jgi:hypothetical protein
MPETSDEALANDEATFGFNPTFRLSHEQRVKAEAWIRSKWTKKPSLCPICGTNRWTISETAELKPFNEYQTGAIGGLSFSGPTTPVFMVICNNCAYTMVFNAVISGVVPRPPIMANPL